MSDGPLSIGVDIGGTKVAAGVVDASGVVLRRARRDTPDRSKSPRVVEDTIVSAVQDSEGGWSGRIRSILQEFQRRRDFVD